MASDGNRSHDNLKCKTYDKNMTITAKIVCNKSTQHPETSADRWCRTTHQHIGIDACRCPVNWFRLRFFRCMQTSVGRSRIKLTNSLLHACNDMTGKRCQWKLEMIIDFTTINRLQPYTLYALRESQQINCYPRDILCYQIAVYFCIISKLGIWFQSYAS